MPFSSVLMKSCAGLSHTAVSIEGRESLEANGNRLFLVGGKELFDKAHRFLVTARATLWRACWPTSLRHRESALATGPSSGADATKLDLMHLQRIKDKIEEIRLPPPMES
jgi:hypothetical protein